LIPKADIPPADASPAIDSFARRRTEADQMPARLCRRRRRPLFEALSLFSFAAAEISVACPSAFSLFSVYFIPATSSEFRGAARLLQPNILLNISQ